MISTLLTWHITGRRRQRGKSARRRGSCVVIELKGAREPAHGRPYYEKGELEEPPLPCAFPRRSSLASLILVAT